MDRSLYIAMTGAGQNMLATAVHANNLANVSTTGFRGDFTQAKAMPVFGGLASRAYALTETPATDMAPGTLQESGRDLDVAINGEGWIAVQAPDGSEAYTRAGDLRIDTSGLLLTGSGLPVMGNGAPISLPPAQSVNIGIDGTVSVRPLGASAQEIAEVDRIKLVKPEPRQLFKGEDGLMHSRDGAPILADANVRLESGFLESSNVNAISALTDLISLSRQFEMQIKLMKTTERNAQASAQLLQFS